MRRHAVRIVGVTLLLVAALAGAFGCDKIRDAVEGIRRSTDRAWDQGRRRL